MVIRDAQRRRYVATQMMDNMRRRIGDGAFSSDPRVVQSHQHVAKVLEDYAASHALPRRQDGPTGYSGAIGRAQTILVSGRPEEQKVIFERECMDSTPPGIGHLVPGQTPAERVIRGIPAGYAGYIPREIREQSIASNPVSRPSRFLPQTSSEPRPKTPRQLSVARSNSAQAASRPWPPWPHGERPPCTHDALVTKGVAVRV